MDNSIIQRGEFPNNWSGPSTFQTATACELLRIPDASDDMLTCETEFSDTWLKFKQSRQACSHKVSSHYHSVLNKDTFDPQEQLDNCTKGVQCVNITKRCMHRDLRLAAASTGHPSRLPCPSPPSTPLFRRGTPISPLCQIRTSGETTG